MCNKLYLSMNFTATGLLLAGLSELMGQFALLSFAFIRNKRKKKSKCGSYIKNPLPPNLLKF